MLTAEPKSKSIASTLKESWAIISGAIIALTATGSVVFGLGVKYEEAVASKENVGLKIEIATAKGDSAKYQAQLETANGKIDRLSDAISKLKIREDELLSHQATLYGKIDQLSSGAISSSNCAFIHIQIKATEHDIAWSGISIFSPPVPADKLQAQRDMLEARLARYQALLNSASCK